MNDLVSISQSAFIKKRCIQDNFLYVRNLARAYHRTKTPSLLFKLDIEKAFDSVSWEYLPELLERRGFPARWRNWIALILSSSSSSVILNGVPDCQVLSFTMSGDFAKETLCHLIFSSWRLTPYTVYLSLQHWRRNSRSSEVGMQRSASRCMLMMQLSF